MQHPALAVPAALQALQALSKAIQATGLPPKAMELVSLRASQILAGLVLAIAGINVWNRLNVTTRQVAGVSWD